MLVKIQKIVSFRGRSPPELLTKGSALIPGWGSAPKPHISSRSALAMLPLLPQNPGYATYVLV
jgi:hypothetical protein